MKIKGLNEGRAGTHILSKNLELACLACLAWLAKLVWSMIFWLVLAACGPHPPPHTHLKHEFEGLKFKIFKTLKFSLRGHFK